MSAETSGAAAYTAKQTPATAASAMSTGEGGFSGFSSVISIPVIGEPLGDLGGARLATRHGLDLERSVRGEIPLILRARRFGRRRHLEDAAAPVAPKDGARVHGELDARATGEAAAAQIERARRLAPHERPSNRGARGRDDDDDLAALRDGLDHREGGDAAPLDDDARADGERGSTPLIPRHLTRPRPRSRRRRRRGRAAGRARPRRGRLSRARRTT